MQIHVGLAKVGKYAVGVSGDSVEVVERPRGGLSVVIVDGQGHGRSAKRLSHLVSTKAASLISDGARDGAVMRAISDYLYALRDGMVSATVTILTADIDHKALVVSRNSNSPVVVGHKDGSSYIESEVNPIGVHRLNRPMVSQLPLFPGSTLIGFTDGVTHSGRHSRNPFSMDLISALLEEPVRSPQVLADTILTKAIALDGGKPKDDMVVAVMTISGVDKGLGTRRMTVSYPF